MAIPGKTFSPIPLTEEEERQRLENLEQVGSIGAAGQIVALPLPPSPPVFRGTPLGALLGSIEARRTEAAPLLGQSITAPPRFAPMAGAAQVPSGPPPVSTPVSPAPAGPLAPPSPIPSLGAAPSETRSVISPLPPLPPSITGPSPAPSISGLTPRPEAPQAPAPPSQAVPLPPPLPPSFGEAPTPPTAPTLPELPSPPTGALPPLPYEPAKELGTMTEPEPAAYEPPADTWSPLEPIPGTTGPGYVYDTGLDEAPMPEPELESPPDPGDPGVPPGYFEGTEDYDPDSPWLPAFGSKGDKAAVGGTAGRIFGAAGTGGTDVYGNAPPPMFEPPVTSAPTASPQLQALLKQISEATARAEAARVERESFERMIEAADRQAAIERAIRDGSYFERY